MSDPGLAIIGDHVTDEDGAAAAWHQEVERLRDPSHWSYLTPARIRCWARARLELDEERLISFGLDLDEWLSRSSAGADAAGLILSCLSERPAGTQSFKVIEEGGSQRLELLYSLTRWRRP